MSASLKDTVDPPVPILCNFGFHDKLGIIVSIILSNERMRVWMEGGTNVSFQLKFRPFISSQLTFSPFVSCQLNDC